MKKKKTILFEAYSNKMADQTKRSDQVCCSCGDAEDLNARYLLERRRYCCETRIMKWKDNDLNVVMSSQMEGARE